MEYIIVVLGKFLMMSVAYSLHKQHDSDRITAHYSQFNNSYAQLSEAFLEVTGEVFRPGEKVVLKNAGVRPVVSVRPTVRPALVEALQGLSVSDQASSQLKSFLEKNGLAQLVEIFVEEGITLPDVLQMPEEEMKRLGIKFYGVRRRLMTAVEEHQSASSQRGSQAPQERQEEEVQGAGPAPRVLAMKQLWEDRMDQGPGADWAHQEIHRPEEPGNKTVAAQQKGEVLYFIHFS